MKVKIWGLSIGVHSPISRLPGSGEICKMGAGRTISLDLGRATPVGVQCYGLVYGRRYADALSARLVVR
jgi:hypothetical protein